MGVSEMMGWAWKIAAALVAIVSVTLTVGHMWGEFDATVAATRQNAEWIAQLDSAKQDLATRLVRLEAKIDALNHERGD